MKLIEVNLEIVLCDQVKKNNSKEHRQHSFELNLHILSLSKCKFIRCPFQELESFIQLARKEGQLCIKAYVYSCYKVYTACAFIFKFQISAYLITYFHKIKSKHCKVDCKNKVLSILNIKI